MDISAISVSRKGVWDLCEVAYKYQYHLKYEQLENPFYFTYGSIIHKIAEEYCEKGGQIPLNEVAKDIIEGKIPIEEDKEGNPVFAPYIPREYKERMPDHIHSIKKLTDKIGTEGFTEWEFMYDLEPPNGKFVKGFIDRLIQKDDKFFIIDYKTTKKGKWRKNEFNIVHDLQLRTYARVVQKHFNAKPENISAALYYLEGGNLIAAKFSEQSLEYAEKELLNTYNKIIATPPENATANVGEHCRRCQWRTICPYFKSHP